MTAVAELLTQSRAAHQAARAAGKDAAAAEAQWKTALELRLEARRLDPDRTDPSWLEDAVHPRIKGETAKRYHRVPGKTTADVAVDKDAELVAFFLSKLQAEDPAPLEPLTPEGIAARVIVPKRWTPLVPPNPDLPPCKPHLWLEAAGRRTCTACGAHEQLLATTAVEETEAFKQLQRERAK